jgi:hypothetical protein
MASGAAATVGDNWRPVESAVAGAPRRPPPVSFLVASDHADNVCVLRGRTARTGNGWEPRPGEPWDDEEQPRQTSTLGARQGDRHQSRENVGSYGWSSPRLWSQSPRRTAPGTAPDVHFDVDVYAI